MIYTAPIMSTKKSIQRQGRACSSWVRNSKVYFQFGTKCWQRTNVMNVIVMSSRCLEPPHRTLARLSQFVSTAQRDAKHRWTAETASSLGVVGLRQCMAERQSTEPCEWAALLDALLDWTGSQWRDFNGGLAVSWQWHDQHDNDIFVRWSLPVR